MRMPLVTSLLAMILPAAASAQAPATLTYQGKLLDSAGAPQTGAVEMTFAVWDDPTAGSLLWCEKQSVALSGDGYYSVHLGKGTACLSQASTPLPSAFSGPNRHLEIAVNGSTLTPRQPITSVPFALVAGALANGGASFIANQTASDQPASFRIQGSGTVVGAAPFQGTGTVSTSSVTNPTSVVGNGTQFGTEVIVGDLITINGQSQHVTAVADATHLTVDGSWTSTTAGLTFQVQKGLLRLEAYPSTASANPAFLVNDKGRVGLGTSNLAQRLVVSGACYENAVAITGEACSQYILMGNQNSSGADNPSIIEAANGHLIFGHGSSWSSPNGGTMTRNVIIRPDGMMGIGVHPAHVLHLGSDDAAKPGGGSWKDSSDIRLKKNVTPMTGALDTLTRLQGVQFDWIHPEEHGHATARQGGFIAQEVEKVFPSWVTRSETGPQDKALVGSDGAASLALPFEFDALVVESIKELRAENQALKTENIALRSRNRALEKQFGDVDARLKAVEEALRLRAQKK